MEGVVKTKAGRVETANFQGCVKIADIPGNH